MAVKSKDRIGQKYGEWTVIATAKSRTNKGGSKEQYWTCQCSCGRIQEVATRYFRTAQSTRCNACAGKARAAIPTLRKLHPNTYTVWVSMKQRCLCPTNRAYAYYGGRGITISERWVGSFKAFFEDMGPMPAGKSLDRIDVNGPYSKENCRWATDEEQMNNTRLNVRVVYDGQPFTLKQLARYCEVNYLKLFHQYRTKGRPIDESIAEARKLAFNKRGGTGERAY